MDSKLSRWCDGLIEAGWLTAVIAIPLYFNIHSDRVFEPDKLTLLRSIALLMSAAWLVKFIDLQGWQHLKRLRWNDEESIWRKPFIMPVLLLVSVYLVSTALSVTPRVSWAGSYQRLQGTYTTLSYIVVFALLISTIRTRAQVSRVVTAVIITSIPISFYALLQHFDLDPLPWGGNVVRRVAGHMGNAIFIAAYLIMAVPLTISRIIDAFTKILSDDELATADVVRSSVYIFTAAIQLIAIYWSQSRGPWLGLFAGLFAFILIVLVSLRNAAAETGRFRWRDGGRALALAVGGTAVLFTIFLFAFNTLVASGRLAALAGSGTSFAALAAAVGLLVLIIFVMIAARRGWRWLWLAWLMLSLIVVGWLAAFNFGDELDARFGETAMLSDITDTLVAWQELPAIGRLGRLLDSESRTGQVRVLIWDGALDLLSVHAPLKFPDGGEDSFNFLRPLIGYGPESMYVAYNPFYPPELATVEARNASPDRSHNETFDALVITGAFGFIVWQALYLSVFYYGFRWLGVIRTKRDRNLLIAAWVSGAVIVTLLITQTMGMPFLGVAIPFGSILGLILYLIYYALTAQTSSDETADPFHLDRLLMTALVAAVLAHYVEIHFGIAIAATRTYFFVYVALMFLVGYRLPQLAEPAAVAEPTKSRKRRRVREDSAWAPLLFFAFSMALTLGILGFEYMTYSLPPDKVIGTAADLPASEIFYQALFVNARNGFVDSPFIFLMMMLTWVLGTLVGVSEMVKGGELSLTAVDKHLPSGRKQAVLAILGIMALGSIVLRFLPAAEPIGATAALGRSLLFIWAGLAAWAAIRLQLNLPASQLFVGGLALGGLLLTIPVLVAGGMVFGLGTAVLSLLLLYLLWNKDWRDNLGAVGIAAFLSIGLGLLYTFVQASLLRSSLLFQPPPNIATIEELRILEASQSTVFLTAFYFFTFAIIFASSLVLVWPEFPRLKKQGTAVAYAGLIVLFIAAFVGINRSNMRIIQADVIYKRGKPFDDQATRGRDIESWKVATAIYEEALSLAPKEDFYYLFLGRAYLEQSTITTDPAEQAALLDTAEKRLLLAQDINPLNTDHTANLARLNTRWWQLSNTEFDKQSRAETAASFYEDALILSPQNSVIRNEYARLAYDILDDCPQAIDLYEESVAVDPYYDITYFGRADVYVACVATTDEVTRLTYYSQAITSLEEGLALSNENVRAWLQAAQLYQQLERYDEALTAYEEAGSRNQGEIPVWNLDFLVANLYLLKGDEAMALSLAEQSLAAAPPDVTDQIRQFIAELTGEDPMAETADLAANVFADQEITPLSGERPLANLDPAARNNYYATYPPLVIDTAKTYEAIISTVGGDIRLRLFADLAPLAVNNFVFLANEGFYDGTTFHRVIEDFMAQGGDPTGIGSGGPGYQFADETGSGLRFDRGGLLAMANAGPATNGSQFFITYAETSWLDGNHTIFGELVAGEDALNALSLRDPVSASAPGDVIERIDIVEVAP